MLCALLAPELVCIPTYSLTYFVLAIEPPGLLINVLSLDCSDCMGSVGGARKMKDRMNDLFKYNASFRNSLRLAALAINPTTILNKATKSTTYNINGQ
jgi:hypothetical protein